MENAWIYLVAVHLISFVVFGVWYAVAYHDGNTPSGEDELPTTVGTNSARS